MWEKRKINGSPKNASDLGSDRSNEQIESREKEGHASNNGDDKR